MTAILTDLLLFSCLAAFITGIIIAAASLSAKARWMPKRYNHANAPKLKQPAGAAPLAKA